jgi:hypothetical protein
MKKTKLENAIFEAEVTLYRTGNVHILLTNKMTGETKIIQSRKQPQSLNKTMYI